MRVIKFFGWEQALGARVEACRARELGRLRVIKYLDAVCVYLWAALPVVISIVIFITYVLTGHQLTATKVRTRKAGGGGGGAWLQGDVRRKQQHRDHNGVGRGPGASCCWEGVEGPCLPSPSPTEGKFSEGTFHLRPRIYDPSLCEGITSFPHLFLSNFWLGPLSLILIALGEKFMIQCRMDRVLGLARRCRPLEILRRSQRELGMCVYQGVT